MCVPNVKVYPIKWYEHKVFQDELGDLVKFKIIWWHAKIGSVQLIEITS